MKKCMISILIFLTLLETVTGCGRHADIGKDKAAEIALKDAGLTESDVTRLRVSKDKDDGQIIYEVQFSDETAEYEYEILADRGDILSSDYDTLNMPRQQTENSSQTPSAAVQISLEEASKLALDRVPGASAQNLKIELDYDDGRYKYEGDIIYDMKEYEFEIDADTGNFLKWEEER